MSKLNIATLTQAEIKAMLACPDAVIKASGTTREALTKLKMEKTEAVLTVEARTRKSGNGAGSGYIGGFLKSSEFRDLFVSQGQAAALLKILEKNPKALHEFLANTVAGKLGTIS